MNNLGLYQELEKLLRMESRYCSEDGVLLKNSIVESALALRPDLIKMLLSHDGLKNNFFAEVDGLLVFDKVKFQKFVMNKRFLADSYTSFKNKIGLTGDDDEFLSESREVVLSWPYKDCVLEGGQTKEDAKRNEVFWNEILAPDEINRLTEPKVLTGFKRYTANGAEEVKSVSKNDNLIIKGNNLLALHSLLKAYRNQVKLIYIDPPYNTGNDGFQYNDSFNHSSWLTFMRNRLTVARELLKEDGVIFVSLDDKEAHYCKILLDNIFGRENFIADICHKARASVSNDKIISPNHNHILFFAKNERKVYENREQYGIGKDLSTFNEKDEKGYYKLVPVDGPGGEKKGNPHYEFLGITNYWRFSFDRMSQMYNDGLIVKKGKGLYQKYYRSKAESTKQTITTWWDEGLLTSSATSQLNDLIGEGLFNNPKNESLLELIIEFATNQGDIVLDYHLGSGTTAAVAHKMGRRYIGVEQMDYIETVAVERLRKVIGTKKEGTMFADEHDCDQGGISKAVNWKGGGEFVYCELAKANQNFVDSITQASTKEQLTEIWKQIEQTGFLSWKIDPKSIDEQAQSFADLSVDDTKRFLIECLDKNLLYVPCSEIDNAEFAISAHDKSLNAMFYSK